MRERENNKNQQQSRVITHKTTSENKGLSMMPPPFQFKCATCDEEEIQMKTDPQREIKPFQFKPSSPNAMPQEVQAKMENAFGHDFSNVNIHTNSNSAKDMGALAYAQGNDVHFAAGQYNPQSQKGQELIGHELTHVVQQREGRVKPTKQAKGVAVNDDKGLEKEADDMGRKAARGNAKTSRAAVQKKCNECEKSEEEKVSQTKLSNVAQLSTEVIQMHSVEDCEEIFEKCRRLPNKTKRDKARRALCWSTTAVEYAACVATASETLTFAAMVAAIVLVCADGPFPIGDAAAAALLISVGVMPD